MARLNRTNGLYIVSGSLLVITAILASSNLALADPLTPIQGIEQRLGIPDETDVKAPVDYGPGPGVKPNVEIGETTSLSVDSRSTSQIPVGGAGANIAGAFGPAVASHSDSHGPSAEWPGDELWHRCERPTGRSAHI